MQTNNTTSKPQARLSCLSLARLRCLIRSMIARCVRIDRARKPASLHSTARMSTAQSTAHSTQHTMHHRSCECMHVRMEKEETRNTKHRRETQRHKHRRNVQILNRTAQLRTFRGQVHVGWQPFKRPSQQCQNEKKKKGERIQEVSAFVVEISAPTCVHACIRFRFDCVRLRQQQRQSLRFLPDEPAIGATLA